MKPDTITFDARKTVAGRIFVTALVASFLLGVFLIGRSSLSLIERKIIDDRMQREGKVLSGVVVGYEERKSARRGRFYWIPVVRVSAGATVVDIPDQHRFFDVKPEATTNIQQVVTLDFLTELSILRVRESYLADKPRLIRNDLGTLLLGFLLSAMFLFAWLRGRRTKKQEVQVPGV